MAILQNTDFETEGASPGEPLDWSFLKLGTTAFDAPPLTGGYPKVEHFENGWDNDNYQFVFRPMAFQVFFLTTLLVGENKTVEDYGELWDTEGYLLELNEPLSAQFQGPLLGKFVSTDTPKAIPDNLPAGATSVINVSGMGAITEVWVRVKVTHTFVGDLDVKLSSPSIPGADGNIWNNAGHSQDDFDVFLDVTSIFGLGTINGDWTLFAADQAAVDFGTVDLWELSFFDPRVGAEAFDTGWDVETWAETFDFVTGVTENFESDWSNSGWSNNFDVIGSVNALFYNGSQGVENFLVSSPFSLFTVDNAAAGIMHSSGAVLALLGTVVFRNSENSLLPTPLLEGPSYIVSALLGPGQFQVSKTTGGPVVALSDEGLGTHFVARGPDSAWNQTMVTV